jgi:hypothetical protein
MNLPSLYNSKSKVTKQYLSWRLNDSKFNRRSNFKSSIY